MIFADCMLHPLNDIARGYKLLRDAIKAEDAGHAERMAPHKEQLKVYETAMQAKLQEQGVSSAKTDFGTPYLSVKETVKIEDWEVFHAWVEELQEPDFLARACAPTKVLEWRDIHKQLPPGVSTSSYTSLNFRS